MESLLNRYRNITVLLLVIMAQLVLLAVSAKNDQDVRFIRIWTVTAVTPVARIIEGLRGGSTGFLHNYILLHDTNKENRRLRSELDRMKMENVFLKNELNTSDRAKALQVFQQHTPSKTVAATIIATGAGSNSKVVFVDRGTVSGVQRGMAVVTPDGIVGKVIATYPTASQVLLITDSDFAAGVVTEKNQVHGTLKGQGTPQCKVDYVAFEEKVEPGEWVYTSGDDRIFPRGFRVGVVKAVRPGQPFKEILVEPSGMRHGLVEDVLILIEGVHQRIPDAPVGMQPIYIAPAPPGDESKPAAAAVPTSLGTEADRLRSQYQTLGEEQKHTYGENPPGTKPVDFTRLANPGGAGQGAAGGQSTVPPAGAPLNPAAGKNPPLPGASPATPAAGLPKAGRNQGPGAGTGPAGNASPPAGAPLNPAAGKNPPSPGASPATPAAGLPKAGRGQGPGAGTGPAGSPSPPAGAPLNPAAGKNPPLPGASPATPAAGLPKAGRGQGPGAGKNSPSPGAPPIAPAATPAKNGTGGQASAPARGAPSPAGTPGNNLLYAARRLNPSADTPPGGQLPR